MINNSNTNQLNGLVTYSKSKTVPGGWRFGSNLSCNYDHICLEI